MVVSLVMGVFEASRTGPQPSFCTVASLPGIPSVQYGFYKKFRQAPVKASFFLMGKGGYQIEEAGPKVTCLGTWDSRMISIA